MLRPTPWLSLVLAAACSMGQSWAEEPATALINAGPAASPLTAPPDPVAYYRELLIAKRLLDEKRFADAELPLERLTLQYPLDRETWIGLATVKRKLGKHRESIAAYREAIRIIGPVPGGSRYWIAVGSLALGDRAGALDALETMVFEDRELDRPGLAEDASFAALADEPRFRRLVGKTSAAGADRNDGWVGDLDHLVSEIRRLSPDHRTGELPAEAVQLHRQLRADVATLTDEQIFAGMARIIGSLHQGHTMMWGAGPPGSAGAPRMTFSYLPLLFHAFPEGIHVVSADDAHRDLVGARLLTVSSLPATEALRRVSEATGSGSGMEALWSAPVRLSEVQLLQGLGISDRTGKVSLGLQLSGGAIVDRVVEGVKESPRSKLPAPPGVAAPAFLRNVREAHWLERWPDLGTVYVQFNQVADDPPETLSQFASKLRTELRDPLVANVVVDVRHNNGGNTFTYKELVRTLVWFSAQERRQLYVIIGRGVYSAAANFCADLERFADPIFVGEPTSMTGNQHGDEGAVLLPYSGLRATISGVKWQLSHPWDRRRSIVPHVPVQLTAKDYLAGRDPALDAIRRLIEGAGPPSKDRARP